MLPTTNYKLPARTTDIIQSGRQTNKGFTLVELLLYISLSGIILLSVSLFMASLLEARVKNQTIAAVEQEGAQVMEIINQALRNATAINSPATGTSAVLLSINTIIPENNPTIFDVSSSTIRIQEGVGPAVPLTSNRIIVSDLNFKNLTKPFTRGNIRTTFTLSHVH
ncbi:MAG: prepilin-type N-terminal cleavage/methylation domain-containing protein [bacterium]|nr:prepilin-type N-terminal cleavage/methylation domain-containing protein [bacterium]